MNINTLMANSTIKQLRIQAYHMWGIAPNRVVYNMPYKKFKQDFVFKINYDTEFRAFPKSYNLIVPGVCDLERIIMPIVIVNTKLDIYRKAWYDMSKSVNDQIIDIVYNEKRYKNNKWYKRLLHSMGLGDNYQEQIPVEDYLFYVKQNENGKLTVSLLK